MQENNRLPWFWSGWEDASLWEDGMVPEYAHPVDPKEGLKPWAGKTIVTYFGQLYLWANKAKDISGGENDWPKRIYLDLYPQEWLSLWEFDEIPAAFLERLYVLPPRVAFVPEVMLSDPRIGYFHFKKGGIPVFLKDLDVRSSEVSKVDYDPVELPREAFEQLFGDVLVDDPRDWETVKKVLPYDAWLIDSGSLATMQAFFELAATYSKKLMWRNRHPHVFTATQRGALAKWVQQQPFELGVREIIQKAKTQKPIDAAFKPIDEAKKPIAVTEVLKQWELQKAREAEAKASEETVKAD